MRVVTTTDSTTVILRAGTQPIVAPCTLYDTIIIIRWPAKMGEDLNGIDKCCRSVRRPSLCHY